MIRKPSSAARDAERPWQFLLASLFAIAVTLLLAPPAHSKGTLKLQPCRVEGLPEEVLCTRHEVFEDRSTASGRKLSLNIAVLPAVARRPAPDPLFLLAGGPGQAATDLARLATSTFKKVRSQRDIVLVDLRGTGGSNALDCEFDPGLLSGLTGDSLSPADIKDCLASLDADVRFYTTDLAIDDLDEAREALGYEKINLWGGSYGTRAALVYLERHPRSIRSAILDGVAPYDIKLPLYYARDGQRALDLLFEDCANEASCSVAYPELAANLDRVLADLRSNPRSVELRHPRSGEPMTVVLTADAFVGNLRNFLYVPQQASLVPWILHRAANADFAAYAAASNETLRWSVDSMSLGFTLSILCSEELPRIDPAEVDEAIRGSFLGRLAFDTWSSMCAVWPRGNAPSTQASRPKSDVPALLLSGRLDPVTPPSWGEKARKLFNDSLHVVVLGAGHNTVGSPCVQRIMADFLDAGSVTDLDASCVAEVKRPPFVVSLAGSVP